MTAAELTVTKLQLSCGQSSGTETGSMHNSLLTLYAAWITPALWNVPTVTAHTCFNRLVSKMTYYVQRQWSRGEIFAGSCRIKD